jgi:hypothetical protein
MSKDVTSRRHFLKVAGTAAGAGLFVSGLSLDAVATLAPRGVGSISHNPNQLHRTIPCESPQRRSRSHLNTSCRRSPTTVSSQDLCCASKKASR